MYGTVARIGIVIPCVNTTMEPEFHRLAQSVSGVTIHSARVHTPATGDNELTAEGLFEMERQAIDTVVPELAHAKMNLIVYGCTSGSFIGGPEWNEEILRRMTQRSGAPATTTSTAVVTALHSLGARRIALGTPYDEAITSAAQRFLEGHGFEVVKAVALNCLPQLREANSALAHKLATQADHPEADCIFISCTQFPTLMAIQDLETDRKKTIVSSNVASFWHACQLLGLRAPRGPFGELLRQAS